MRHTTCGMRAPHLAAHRQVVTPRPGAAPALRARLQRRPAWPGRVAAASDSATMDPALRVEVDNSGEATKGVHLLALTSTTFVT